MRRFETRWNGEVVAGYDMLLAWGVIMLALFVLASPPRPKAAEQKQQPPGALTVQMFWPDDSDADIDLWVRAPGDRPVGYSNKDGAVFSLLRDDLGVINDTSGKNFEVAYSRTLPQGEFVVNCHSYSVRSSAPPIPVKVVVQIRRPGASTETLATVDAQLDRAGQEITVLRFRLDEHAALVPGSQNNLPTPLRSAP